MGGKPQKPKIQAYVGQRWFDYFTDYCQEHGLNQSNGFERLLIEKFAKPSDESAEISSLHQPIQLEIERLDQAGNALASTCHALVDLTSNLRERIEILEDRQNQSSEAERLVNLESELHHFKVLTLMLWGESALARQVADAESADESAESAQISIESADELLEVETIESAESAQISIESAVELANGHAESAFESAIKSAVKSCVTEAALLEETGIESVDSALEALKATIKKAESLVESADESADEPLEIEGITQSALARRLGKSHTAVAKHRQQGDLLEWSRVEDPEQVGWRFDRGAKLYYPAA